MQYIIIITQSNNIFVPLIWNVGTDESMPLTSFTTVNNSLVTCIKIALSAHKKCNNGAHSEHTTIKPEVLAGIKIGKAKILADSNLAVG